MQTIDQIIRGCQKYHKSSQKELYGLYASKMKAICLRYCNNSDDAKDVLQDAFLKIFMNIKQYGWKGSFEGWMKRIVINTALNYLKKNQQKNKITSIDENLGKNDIAIEDTTDYFYSGNDENVEIDSLSLTEIQLLEIIQGLPEAFRVVFNLYCIEDYSHDEIADQLDISTGTSRSRLARARKMIQQEIIRIQSLSRHERATQ